jgi:hypothetical protein
MRALLLPILVSTATFVPSIASADRELCEKRWPASAKPPAKDSQTCLDYFVKTYLEGYDTTYDPPGDHEVLSRFTRAELRQMAKNVPAARSKTSDDPTINDRVKEFFEHGASQWAATTDLNLQESIIPYIDTVFAGKKLDPEMMEKLSFISLVKLRNAPYARWGRAFKHPDLQSFYYDIVKKKPVDPTFTDAKLDKVDHWNVALIMKIQKAKGAK